MDEIFTVKQLLSESIVENDYDYINGKINKTVKNCNNMYTQVCMMIKLFILYCDKHYSDKNIYYNFNELFIRNCFHHFYQDYEFQ